MAKLTLTAAASQIADLQATIAQLTAQVIDLQAQLTLTATPTMPEYIEPTEVQPAPVDDELDSLAWRFGFTPTCGGKLPARKLQGEVISYYTTRDGTEYKKIRTGNRARSVNVTGFTDEQKAAAH